MRISELQDHLERALLEFGDVEIMTHADGAGSNIGYVKFYDGELHLFDKMYGDKSWDLCFKKSYGEEPK